MIFLNCKMRYFLDNYKFFKLINSVKIILKKLKNRNLKRDFEKN